MFLLLAVAACTSERAPNGRQPGSNAQKIEPDNRNEKMVIEDLTGRTVEISGEINRVVGLRAGALRLLTYMDVVPLIAGVEEPDKRDERPYTLARPALKKLPPLGPIMGGDPEMILAARPDVIFKTYTTREDADKLQRQTGIPVVALECTDLGTANDTLFTSLQIIGRVTGREARADSLISFIRSNIRKLDDLTGGIPASEKPTVYVGGLSYSMSYGISATHAKFAPFMFVNADNVASSIDERLTSHVSGTFVDIEQLMRWDPDYIFVDQSGYPLVVNDLQNRPALKNSLGAVRNEQIHTILPYNNYATNYEFVLLNAWYIGQVLYPGQFGDASFEDRAAEILQAFYPGADPEKITDKSALRPIDADQL